MQQTSTLWRRRAKPKAREATREVWPWGARFVWVFFLGLTEWIVFADVFQHGAPITTKHAFTQGVLLGTYFCAHVAWPQIRRGRIITGTFAAIFAIAGSYMVLFSSAGRNAEANESKATLAREHNGDRKALERALKHAEAERDKTAATHADLIEASLIADKAVAQPCKEWGPYSKLCKDAKAAALAAEQKAVRAEAAKDKAYSAYLDAYGKLSLSKPMQVEDAEIHQMAELLVKLPWITATKEELEAMHKVGIPVGMAIFAEAMLLISASIRVRVPVNPARSPRLGWFRWPSRRSFGQSGAESTGSTELTALPSPRDGGATEEAASLRPLPNAPRAPAGKMGKDEACAYVLTQAALGNGYGQDALARACGVSGSTMHDWLKDWEAAGLITRAKVGKRNEIRAANAPA